MHIIHLLTFAFLLTACAGRIDAPIVTSVQLAETTDNADLPPVNAQATNNTTSMLCDEFSFFPDPTVLYSPDNSWMVIVCGGDSEKVLLVKGQAGLRWVLRFEDFLSAELQGVSGGLWPLAWSRDGRLLYFAEDIGYSGGGNQCFPGFGFYGLYGLDVNSGAVHTLLALEDDSFPGVEIRFSPSGEYYATDIDGVTITSFADDSSVVLEVPTVMEMIWSPDSRYLAFSIAICGEEIVESSSIFIWDSSTKEMRPLFFSEEMKLLPRFWKNNSLLEFVGEEWVGLDTRTSVFEYDFNRQEVIFSATATPAQ